MKHVIRVRVHQRAKCVPDRQCDPHVFLCVRCISAQSGHVEKSRCSHKNLNLKNCGCSDPNERRHALFLLNHTFLLPPFLALVRAAGPGKLIVDTIKLSQRKAHIFHEIWLSF